MESVQEFMATLPPIEPPAEWGWVADARVADLPLLNVWSCLFLVAAYLVFVVVGPIVMSLLPPLGLKPLQKIYNFIMIGLSGYMFWELTYNTVVVLGHGLQLWFLPIQHNEAGDRIARALWLFYVSKPIEFIDTVFIVLNKKNNQLSFLHVYHHATIFIIWLINVRYFPGGDAWFAAAFNAFVHVLMYSYYLLTSFQIKVPFKSLLTLFQILQFVSFVGQGVAGLVVGNPYLGTEILTINMVYAFTLLALFVNFFVSSYSKKDDAHAGAQAPAKGSTKPKPKVN